MDDKKTFPELIAKAENYCSKSEHCQSEVKKKLKQWGADYEQAENIVAHLISENYINELRYAQALVHDAFYIQSWGRLKIRQKLMSKFISEYSMNKSLEQISDDEYTHTLNDLAKRKYASISDQNVWKRWSKVERYLLNRGFEGNRVRELRRDFLPD